MNSVELIGRLTRDPDEKQGATTFTIAIDRPVVDTKQADYPRIVTFGRLAETCAKFLKRGRLVAIQGRLQTGSYQNRNGDTVYTTDVVANRVDFLGGAEQKPERKPVEAPPDFEQIDADIPF